MPHFVVYPSQYRSFQIQADNEHWNRLTQADLDLVARLVNGDYSVLSQEPVVGRRRRSMGSAIMVRDIDTTAKTLTIEEVREPSPSSLLVPSQPKVLLLCG